MAQERIAVTIKITHNFMRDGKGIIRMGLHGGEFNGTVSGSWSHSPSGIFFRITGDDEFDTWGVEVRDILGGRHGGAVETGEESCGSVRGMRQTNESTGEAVVCGLCGGPMSRNPHPKAGHPGSLLEVGATWMCIPCNRKALHKASQGGRLPLGVTLEAVLAMVGSCQECRPSGHSVSICKADCPSYVTYAALERAVKAESV